MGRLQPFPELFGRLGKPSCSPLSPSVLRLGGGVTLAADGCSSPQASGSPVCVIKQDSMVGALMQESSRWGAESLFLTPSHSSRIASGELGELRTMVVLSILSSKGGGWVHVVEDLSGLLR